MNFTKIEKLANKTAHKDEMNGIERLHMQLRWLTTKRKEKSDKMEPSV